MGAWSKSGDVRQEEHQYGVSMEQGRTGKGGQEMAKALGGARKLGHMPPTSIKSTAFSPDPNLITAARESPGTEGNSVK